MFIYPYKIFTIAKEKMLFKESEPWRKVGIYTCDRYNYKNAYAARKRIGDSGIAVLLGQIVNNVNLMCIDMDHCLDENGNIRQEAQDFLSFFDPSEYEKSRSGDGFHIYLLTTKDFKTFKMSTKDSKREYDIQETMGCESWEFWADMKYIVTTTFDFANKNFIVGKHDDLIESLYKTKLEKDKELEEKLQAQQGHNKCVQDALMIFEGQLDPYEAKARGAVLGREPITDMYKLRGCCLKDTKLKELIDTRAGDVDQSSHDAALIAKLLYYTLSYEGAWELAMKTNYYQSKDEYHKKKFVKPDYRKRTNDFISKRKY